MYYNGYIPPQIPNPFTVCAGMQRDIDLLKAQSETQQQSESYYNGLPQKTMIVVESVTDTQLVFLDRPQVFEGNYAGRFFPMRSYPYYEEADIGGKRYYIVKDNFGVWNSFMYTVPI
jgi:hypothetical protein